MYIINIQRKKKKILHPILPLRFDEFWDYDLLFCSNFVILKCEWCLRTIKSVRCVKKSFLLSWICFGIEFGKTIIPLSEGEWSCGKLWMFLVWLIIISYYFSLDKDSEFATTAASQDWKEREGLLLWYMYMFWRM